MEKLIKNVECAQPFEVKALVSYESGRVVSLTLAQRPGVGMTLFAFDQGEGVSTHAAPGDAMAYILEGKASITIDGTAHEVEEGNAIVMPKEVPHAVKALTPFKMLLTVVKP
ncbi:MAG: cupin domain-containing protein [Eubacteriales bacterium]|nr:cupin domain-containing protein [Eubacteriales bacterium]